MNTRLDPRTEGGRKEKGREGRYDRGREGEDGRERGKESGLVLRTGLQSQKGKKEARACTQANTLVYLPIITV